MAEIMEDTFGELLHMDCRNEDIHHLPSPADFMRKILLKGKKLKKDLEDNEADDGEVSDEDEAADISDEHKVDY